MKPLVSQMTSLWSFSSPQSQVWSEELGLGMHPKQRKQSVEGKLAVYRHSSQHSQEIRFIRFFNVQPSDQIV
jgi:hypothetical protein